MGQPLVTERIVTLTAAGGAAPALRCWMASVGEPFKNLAVTISSRGEAWAAGNLTWQIFYGGYWSVGEPFVIGSTHAGGVSQGTAAIAGGAIVQEEIYTDAGPLLPNRIIQHPGGDGALAKGRNGVPIVCLLTNAKAVALTVYITFQSETVADWR